MQITNLFFKLKIKDVKKLIQSLLKFYINLTCVLFIIKVYIYVTQNVNDNLRNFEILKFVNSIYTDVT